METEADKARPHPDPLPEGREEEPSPRPSPQAEALSRPKGEGEAAPTFEHWALVELMGHARIAGIKAKPWSAPAAALFNSAPPGIGLVTEEARFGTKLLRVDVPILDGDGLETGRSFTRYYGGNAIYSVALATKQVALGLVRRIGMAATPFSLISAAMQGSLLIDQGGYECDED